MAIPEELRRRLESLPDSAYAALLAWLDEHFPSPDDRDAVIRQHAREILWEGFPIDWGHDRLPREEIHARR